MKNCGEQKKDTADGEELELLVTIVKSYEMKHYPIAPPDPIDAIKFFMEQMGMTNTGMVKYLDGKSRVKFLIKKDR